MSDARIKKLLKNLRMPKHQRTNLLEAKDVFANTCLSQLMWKSSMLFLKKHEILQIGKASF